MPRIRSHLAVIEGKWSPTTNVSVRGLFDVLSDIHFSNPHSYIYEMFCDAGSLDNIILRMGRDNAIRYLYIGAHGTSDTLCGHGGDISRTKLKNTLTRLTNGSVEGLYLGTCFFGQKENAEFLLNPPNDNHTAIKWVAGYKRPIDWVASSVLDMLFWNVFLYTKGAPIERIKESSEQIKELAPGLIRSMDFCIYTRKTGRNGGVKDLLAE